MPTGDVQVHRLASATVEESTQPFQNGRFTKPCVLIVPARAQNPRRAGNRGRPKKTTRGASNGKAGVAFVDRQHTSATTGDTDEAPRASKTHSRRRTGKHPGDGA
jgi:hypothetical protein